MSLRLVGGQGDDWRAWEWDREEDSSGDKMAISEDDQGGSSSGEKYVRSSSALSQDHPSDPGVLARSGGSGEGSFSRGRLQSEEEDLSDEDQAGVEEPAEAGLSTPRVFPTPRHAQAVHTPDAPPPPPTSPHQPSPPPEPVGAWIGHDALGAALDAHTLRQRR